MQETKSRFIFMMKEHKPCKDEKGNLKQGQEYKVFENKFGFNSIGVIFNWKDGYLNSEPGIPAVQVEDGHTEYWTNGYLNNTDLDINGNPMPAVISAYGGVEEYWVNGKRVG